MVANINSITPILKEVYTGKIRDQLNNDVKTLKRITRSSDGITETIEGKYVTFPIHVERTAGIGSRAEYDYLPEPDRQGYKAAQINLTSAYGAIEVTGQAIDFSESDPQAFARVIDQETSGMKNDLAKDLNRQIYGTNVGTLSTLTGAVATNATSFVVADARKFRRNLLVDIVDVSNSNAIIRTVKVTAVNKSTNTLTVSGADGSAAGASGDLVVVSGSLNNEIYGLDDIIQASGALYGVTDEVWQSTVTNLGGALSEGAMIKLVQDIEDNGGGQPTVGFTTSGVYRSYFNLLSQMRSIVNTQEFSGGFKGLSFIAGGAEIPIIQDTDATPGTIYFVNENNLTFYRKKEWDWLDRDGSMWKQVSTSGGTRDAWKAYMVQRHQLGTDRRNTHGKLTGITES